MFSGSLLGKYKKIKQEKLSPDDEIPSNAVVNVNESTYEPWQNQYEDFLQILPDADPSYLEKMSRQLCGKNEEVRVFIADALEMKDYPKVMGN